MQGKGFEPTIDALFGRNGFFPDTLSKTLYWAVEKIPQLETIISTPPEGQRVLLVVNYWS